MFDGAVVIIDEVHNVVRHMEGGLEEVWQGGVVRPRPFGPPPPFASIGAMLYFLLATARDVRIVALSGTPLINLQRELCVLVCLLRGHAEQVTLLLQAAPGSAQLVRARALLAKHPQVTHVELAGGGARGTTRATLTRGMDGGGDTLTWAEGVVVLLRAVGEVVAEVEGGVRVAPTPAPLLTPLGGSDTAEVGAVVSNARPLVRGLVSYFPGAAMAAVTGGGMPTVHPLTVVRVPMSEVQADRYAAVRVKEMARMRAAKSAKAFTAPATGAAPPPEGGVKSRGDGGPIIAEAFRSHSRMACTLVLPAVNPAGNQGSPDPSFVVDPGRDGASDSGSDSDSSDSDSSDSDSSDSDSSSDSSGGGSPPPPKRARVAEALSSTGGTGGTGGKGARPYNGLSVMEVATKHAAALLGEEPLRVYAPKVAAIVAKVRACAAPSIVYSEFLTRAGVGLVALALEQAGFAPFALRRVGGEWEVVVAAAARPKFIVYAGTVDAATRAVLLRIFNGDLAGLPSKLRLAVEGDAVAAEGVPRVLLVTAAGAEGISTRGVREVHLLEPYWNMGRVEQVVGRAARAGSHSHLPPDQRTVAPFLYAATFTQEQRQRHAGLLARDGGFTSDEEVLAIAERKRKVTDALLGVLREEAFDAPPRRG